MSKSRNDYVCESSDSSTNENESDCDENTDSDESLPDIAALKPYDHEPVCNPRCYNDNKSSDDLESTRVGNTKWCLCKKCEPMQTDTESICCQETNEVPEELFEGNKNI